MSRLQQNLARHFSRLFARAGGAATYLRGETRIAITAAVPGATRFTLEDDTGVTLSSRQRDFLLRASELVDAGTAFIPARGDRIEVAATSGVAVYEIGTLGGESHYRFMDESGSVLRVHTRLVETRTA